MNPRSAKETETQLHNAVTEYLDLALPESAAWTTVAHGLRLTIGQAMKAKRAGTKPGWPDIIILFGSRAHFIELKRPRAKGARKGRTSSDQDVAHEAIRKAGSTVALCHSISQVEGTLRAWGIPLRAAA